MSLPGAAGGLPSGGMPRLTGAAAVDPNDPNVQMVSLPSQVDSTGFDPKVNVEWSNVANQGKGRERNRRKTWPRCKA